MEETKVAFVAGDDGAALVGGEGKLAGIREAFVAGITSREGVQTDGGKGGRQVLVRVLVDVESRGHLNRRASGENLRSAPCP